MAALRINRRRKKTQEDGQAKSPHYAIMLIA
jgi:hypothetical protein